MVQATTTATVTDSTISDNATDVVIRGGHLHVASATIAGNGGNHPIEAAMLELFASVLTPGSAGTCTGVTVVSLGFNYLQGNDCTAVDPSDTVSIVDPGLAPLAPLAPAGPVHLDVRIPAERCPTEPDQLGHQRPSAGPCDIGAIETDP